MKRLLNVYEAFNPLSKIVGPIKTTHTFKEDAINGMRLRSIEHSMYTFDVEILDLTRPTRNGILYPIPEFKKAIEDPRVLDLLNRGALYGEDAHPLDPNDMDRWTEVNPKAWTHKWTKLWISEGKLMGTCQTFTGNGNLMGHAIAGGELPAFSIRVIGEPMKEEHHIKLNNIMLITIDWVRYPGNPTSYVNSSDAFKLMDTLPIEKGFSLSERLRASGECQRILGITDKEQILKQGNGVHIVVGKYKKSDRDLITRMRASSFEF